MIKIGDKMRFPRIAQFKRCINKDGSISIKMIGENGELIGFMSLEQYEKMKDKK